MTRKLTGWLAGIEVLAFGLLEGSMVTLGLLVAPLLFKRITSRDLAGKVFGDILERWFWFGLGCALVLLVTAVVALLKVKPLSRLLMARLGVLVVMTGLISVFGWALSRINSLQASLTKPIEEYSTDVNPRLEIDQLHSLSTNLLSGALYLGLAWFGLSIAVLYRQWGKQSAPNSPAPVEKNEEQPVSSVPV